MKHFMLLLAGICAFTSCEKIVFKKDKASKDVYTNFDYLWNEVDQKYAYFEIKQVNWDEIKIRYRAQLYADMSDDSLFNVLGNMLKELKDDHTNLYSPFNVSVYQVDLKHPQNYDSRIVREFYLNPGITITGGFTHNFIANKQVGYIRYESFMNDIKDDELDYVLNKYADTKGLILDLRSNGGGTLTNVSKLLGRFVNEKTIVLYNRIRDGKGRNDFGDYKPFYAIPSENIKYLKPVMVLIDRGSYSATNDFSLATKALANLVLVGDTTGGGGGLPNGGQLPNGWTYRFSISQSADLNKNNFAEEGVPADIPAQLNLQDRTHDAIIERAVLELL